MSQLVLVFLTDVLKCLYKLSTSKIFEKNTSTTENSETNGKDPPSEGSCGNSNSESCPSSMVDIDCFAVSMVELCVRSRTLLVAGSSHVIVYQFSMTEETLELVVSSIVISDLRMVEGSRLHIRCLEVMHAKENKAHVCPPHMLQTFLGLPVYYFPVPAT